MALQTIFYGAPSGAAWLRSSNSNNNNNALNLNSSGNVNNNNANNNNGVSAGFCLLPKKRSGCQTVHTCKEYGCREKSRHLTEGVCGDRFRRKGACTFFSLFNYEDGEKNMTKQDQLIRIIDLELRDELKTYGVHFSTTYETFCGHLTLEDIFTTDSVYQAAKRCASGFSRKNDTWNFQKNAWCNSLELCKKVLEGKFKPKYYRPREIMERGKKRLIKPPTFECKVVQKVLCDYIIRPLLEPKMIQTNYASVKGRGTKKLYEDVEAALNKHLKEDTEYVIVQSDFSNYFGNIKIEILIWKLLARYIADERILILLHAFSPDEFGLSLGNEASQVPASFFPSAFDHYCKDRNGWDFYRYMDDSLAILPKDEEPLYRQAIFHYCRELCITLKEEKIKTINLGEPFVFCKDRYLIDKNTGQYYRLMNPAIERNEKRKLKKFKEKKAENSMTQEDIDNQYRGVSGSIASHPNTFRARNRLESVYQEAKK